MTYNKQFTVATDVSVYFCDPQSPWQRGSGAVTKTPMVCCANTFRKARTYPSTGKAEGPTFQYINGFYNPPADIQHWLGKAPLSWFALQTAAGQRSRSNGKWPKRALGATRKRDRSTLADRHQLHQNA